MNPPFIDPPFKRIPFKIRIRNFNGYAMHVEVVDCPFGRMREPEVVAFIPELIPYLSKMGNPVSRGTMDLNEQMMMGQLIGDMLFPTQVRSLFLQTAKYKFKPLESIGIRILLELDAEALTAIPWEYCYLHEWKFLRERAMMDYVQDKTMLAALPVWDDDKKARVLRFLDEEHTEISKAGFLPFQDQELNNDTVLNSLDWEVIKEDEIKDLVRKKVKRIQEFGDDFRRGFLGLDSHLSLIRYEPYFDQVLSGPPLQTAQLRHNNDDSQLKIFLCASDPLDLGEIDVEGEINTIARTIRGESASSAGSGDSTINVGQVVIKTGTEDPQIEIVPSPEETLIRTRIDLEEFGEDLGRSDIFHFTGHAGYIYRSEVSQEGQVYSVVANNTTIMRKPSKEDLLWERRIARAMNRAAYSSNGAFSGLKDGFRDIKNASDPLRDIKNASDPLRDIKNASDPLRDIKNASDPLRDIKNASDPLRGGLGRRSGGFAINSSVFEALDRKEGLLVLEKEKTTHVWQDLSLKQLENVIDSEVRNIERAVLADLEPVKPFYDFILYLEESIPKERALIAAQIDLEIEEELVAADMKDTLLVERTAMLLDRAALLLALHRAYLAKLYEKAIGRPTLEQYLRRLLSDIFYLDEHFNLVNLSTEEKKNAFTTSWSKLKYRMTEVRNAMDLKPSKFNWLGEVWGAVNDHKDVDTILLNAPVNLEQLLTPMHLLAGLTLLGAAPNVRFERAFSEAQLEMLEEIALKTKHLDEMEEIPEEFFESNWNAWILLDQFWKVMPHELKQNVLRWRAGSHDVLWASELADMLKDNDIKLVFLNSCKTSQGDTRSFEASGVATTLMQAGIPAVVGMQLSISDKDALEFSSTFYKALAEGDRLEEAVVKGRISMATLKKNGGRENRLMMGEGMAESSEIAQFWGVPTLFLRQEHVADTFRFRHSVEKERATSELPEM